MNKLIEKLAEEAGMIVDKYGLARDAENGLEDGVDIYKFAELIVKEMLVTCVKHPTWTGRMIGNQIKEHFGVE